MLAHRNQDVSVCPIETQGDIQLRNVLFIKNHEEDFRALEDDNLLPRGTYDNLYNTISPYIDYIISSMTQKKKHKKIGDNLLSRKSDKELTPHKYFLRCIKLQKIEELNKLLPNATPKMLNSGLVYACKNGNLSMVKILHNAGANINYYDNFPLYYACIKNKLEVVKYLIDNGANIKIMGNDFLKLAGEKGYYDLFVLLHNLGLTIDLNILNVVLQYANTPNHFLILKYITQHVEPDILNSHLQKYDTYKLSSSAVKSLLRSYLQTLS